MVCLVKAWISPIHGLRKTIHGWSRSTVCTEHIYRRTRTHNPPAYCARVKITELKQESAKRDEVVKEDVARREKELAETIRHEVERREKELVETIRNEAERREESWQQKMKQPAMTSSPGHSCIY